MTTTAIAAKAPRKARFTGLFLAILLQAGFVYALIAGLEIKLGTFFDPGPIIATIPKPVKPPPATMDDRMQQTHVDTIVPPDIIIDQGETRGEVGGITVVPRGPAQAGPADHGPIGLMHTHTIPPYPPIEARLGHQGTVLLRLTINAQGVVTGADVVRTSGYEALDEAARAWVLAHWRYQPTIRGGAAVPATGTVAVKFDLRTAG